MNSRDVVPKNVPGVGGHGRVWYVKVGCGVSFWGAVGCRWGGVGCFMQGSVGYVGVWWVMVGWSVSWWGG